MLDDLTPAVRARFFSKIGPDKRWKAGVSSSGYGAFHVHGKRVDAHRVAWVIANNRDIPDGVHILHDCPDGDDKLCCDGEHLYPGSHARNMADASVKGQSATGDRHGSRTHPERIRRGDRHGLRLHPDCVARSDRNGSRLHPERLPRGEQHKRSKLTESEVLTIRSRFTGARGQVTALARDFGVAKETVRLIVRGETWKHV